MFFHLVHFQHCFLSKATIFDKEFTSTTHDNDGGDSFFENWLHHHKSQECYDGGMRCTKRKKEKQCCCLHGFCYGILQRNGHKKFLKLMSRWRCNLHCWRTSANPSTNAHVVRNYGEANINQINIFSLVMPRSEGHQW